MTSSKGALVIGGWTTDNEPVSTIGCFNSISGWSKLGDLHGARLSHRAVIDSNQVYVVGGEYVQLSTLLTLVT